MGVILRYHVAKRWVKNRVVTIAKWIKREGSKVRRKRLCNSNSIVRNQLEGDVVIRPSFIQVS